MLQAKVFHSAFRTGSATPLLVTADDGLRYVVKLAGAGEGLISLVTEWLGLRVATWLGLPILPPHEISVGRALTAQIQDTEVRELAERSDVSGLACAWIESARTATPEDLSRLPHEIRDVAFLWDVLCLNVDRTSDNPNMLAALEQVWLVDYSAALGLRRVLGSPGWPLSRRTESRSRGPASDCRRRPSAVSRAARAPIYYARPKQELRRGQRASYLSSPTRSPRMDGSLASRIQAANSAIMADRNLEALGEFFTPDYVVHLTDRDAAGGLGTIRGFVGMLFGAFPDLEIEVEILVEGENRVAWQRTLQGTQQGGFMGFPASGRQVVWRDMVTSRFRDGLIAEEWSITDLAERLLVARKA